MKPSFVPGIPGLPSTVNYPTGELFTPVDWQGAQPQTVEDVPLYTWVRVNPLNPDDVNYWEEAVIVDGFPRIL